MRAGRLRESVAIERQGGEDAGDGGGLMLQWVTVKTGVRASISPFAGGERERADAVEASVTHRVRIRYRPGVLANQRLRWEDKSEGRTRTLEISVVREINSRGREIELLCHEVVPAPTQAT